MLSLIVIGVFGIAVLVLLFWPWKGPHMRADLSRDGFQECRIFVSETAFAPRSVHVQHGQPVRLKFFRDHRAPRCTEKMHLIAFGKSIWLPPAEEVSLEFLPERPGRYEFICRKQKFRGFLIVE